MRSAQTRSTLTSTDRNFKVAKQARFGRAPRILPAQPVAARPSRVRSATERAFEASFTRGAHLQRFRGVRDGIELLGEVTQRTCRSYATFSTHGQQFAVVKPLSDGGLRIGVALPEDFDASGLDPASGLGGSSRVGHQFELQAHETLSGYQLGLLRRAFTDATTHAGLPAS